MTAEAPTHPFVVFAAQNAPPQVVNTTRPAIGDRVVSMRNDGGYRYGEQATICKDEHDSSPYTLLFDDGREKAFVLLSTASPRFFFFFFCRVSILSSTPELFAYLNNFSCVFSGTIRSDKFNWWRQCPWFIPVIRIIDCHQRVDITFATCAARPAGAALSLDFVANRATGMPVWGA